MKQIFILMLITLCSLGAYPQKKYPCFNPYTGEVRMFTAQEVKKDWSTVIGTGVNELNRQLPLQFNDLVRMDYIYNKGVKVFVQYTLNVDLKNLTNEQKTGFLGAMKKDAPKIMDGILQKFINNEQFCKMDKRTRIELFRAVGFGITGKFVDNRGNIITTSYVDADTAAKTKK